MGAFILFGACNEKMSSNLLIQKMNMTQIIIFNKCILNQLVI